MANTDPIIEDDLLIIPDNSSKEDNTLFFLDNELPKKENTDMFQVKNDTTTNNNDLFMFDTPNNDTASDLVAESKSGDLVVENSLFDF
jgi:hypothetical protein